MQGDIIQTKTSFHHTASYWID